MKKRYIIPIEFSSAVAKKLKKQAKKRSMPVSALIRMLVVTKLAKLK